MGYWKGMRYYQDGDAFVEVDDTFAEMFPLMEMSPANSPFFISASQFLGWEARN